MSSLEKTISFLNTILPETGLVCIASPFANGGYKHKVFDDTSEAASFAMSLDANGIDAYFALGTLTERRVWNEKTDKWQVRVGTNIHALRSFFLDIDIGENKAASGKGYATVGEALGELKAFCKKTAMPRPTVVSSGGGIHVYWPLDADVLTKDWQAPANALKGLCVAHGLKIDTAVTGDRSRVLRVPGTGNYKTGTRRAVESQIESGSYSVGEITHAIAHSASAAGVKASKPPSTLSSADQDIVAKLMQNAGQIYDSTPADPLKVFKGCLQLREVAKTKGNVEEPMWYAALQMCRFLERGREFGHYISGGHPNYDEGQTDTKLDNLEEKDIGPTTCAKFQDICPTGCLGCQKMGQITSPIQLGRIVHAATEGQTLEVSVTDEEGVTTVEEVELPTAPLPYFRTSEGKIAALHKTADGGEEAETIYEYDLYPSARWYDEGTKTEFVTWRTYLPHDGWKTFELETSLLYDQKALSKEIANRGVLPDIDQMKNLCNYMVSFLQKLQKEEATSKMYAQMGWRDDGKSFVLGDTKIDSAGEVKKCEVSAQMTETRNGFVRKGSLEAWKKYVDIYSRRGCEPQAFAFLAYAAAPLLTFTNLSGLILSMQGQSGIGKTTVMLAGNSIWGHPEELMLNTNGSSVVIDSRIAGMNTLPVSLDEITNMAREDSTKLSELCYSISQGIGRSRLRQDGSQRAVLRWKTIMVTSTNHGLHNALALGKANSAAETLRVFEYEVHKTSAVSKEEADEMIYGLADNHGHAGEIYATYLMKYKDSVETRVREMQRRIDKELNITSQERYWGVLLATVMVAGEIFNELGLVTIDMATIKDWFLMNLGILRKSVNEAGLAADEVLANFLNENNRGIVVTTKGDGRSQVPPRVEVAPTAPLVAHSIPEMGVIYISRTMFKRYCTKNGFDHKVIERILSEKNILLDVNAKKCLGSGTPHSTAQIITWVIDSNHPEISGLSTMPSIIKEKTSKSVDTPTGSV